VHTFNIEGQPVRCIETDDGKRTWLCECADFEARATRHPESFCAHTALAIWWCIDDGSIDIGEWTAQPIVSALKVSMVECG